MHPGQIQGLLNHLEPETNSVRATASEPTPLLAQSCWGRSSNAHGFQKHKKVASPGKQKALLEGCRN